MSKLYTALSVKQYSEILKTKELPLSQFEDGSVGLEFTEDKAYWVNELEKQEDLEHVADYKYAVLIEFGVMVNTINSLIQDKETGRLSAEIIAMYEQMNKPMEVPALQENDTNVLCILAVYQSEETEDGVSQRWMLKTDAIDSPIHKTFADGVHKIVCLGGFPGAVEEAKRLMA